MYVKFLRQFYSVRLKTSSRRVVEKPEDDLSDYIESALMLRTTAAAWAEHRALERYTRLLAHADCVTVKLNRHLQYFLCVSHREKCNEMIVSTREFVNTN